MTGTLVGNSWQSRKQSRQLQVRTSDFDDFEKDHPLKLDLVKIDVEDFEASVLSGMQAIIQWDRPFIVCEILTREHGNWGTLKIIESLGYTPYWITPSGYIRVSRLDFQRGTLLDFLLSPVFADKEIVDDLGELWGLRASQAPARLPSEMQDASPPPRCPRGNVLARK